MTKGTSFLSYIVYIQPCFAAFFTINFNVLLEFTENLLLFSLLESGYTGTLLLEAISI